MSAPRPDPERPADRDVDDDGPSPEDPNRFADEGNAALDAGPDAAPGDAGDDADEDREASLPPGAGTKDDAQAS